MISLPSYLYCTSDSLLQCTRNVIKIQVINTVDDFVAQACQCHAACSMEN